MEQALLYQKDGYRLDVELRREGRKVVVFFPDRPTSASGMRRDGDTDFAERYGLNAVTLSADNADWFQGADFEQVLSALDTMCGWFEHVTFMGSGMGAYGAIKAASRIHVNHVVALSPVAALDPNAAPKDDRNAKDFERLGEVEQIIHHRADKYTILLDTADHERRHMQMFNLPTDKTQQISVVGSAQRTQACLQETGLHDRFVLRLLSGRKVDDLMQALNVAKRKAPSYLLSMYFANLFARPQVARFALDQLETMGAYANRHKRLRARLDRVLTRKQLRIVAA